MLNEKELNKYNRHILLKEFGEAGQLKLKQSKVLVIGAGGLGCPVLQYLTAAGVGNIGIVDFDTVAESNLQRQVLYCEDDIGKSKIIVAADKLHKQNSLINIIPYNIKLNTFNAEKLFNEYQIIVDCTDNFSSRYLINDLCAILGKPMVYGSVHKFQGQVSVFNFKIRDKKPTTYRCLFPNPPESANLMSCSEIGVLGVLPGIIGIMQATEVIKIITCIGEVLSGKLLCFDALTMQTTMIEIERSSDVENITPSTLEEFINKNYDLENNCSSSFKLKEITAGELHELLTDKNNIQLLDVRYLNEPPFIDELTDLQIPLHEIENNHFKISRDKEVIVYCKKGIRSAVAIEILTNKFQFTNLINLKGGVDEWIRFKNKISKLKELL